MKLLICTCARLYRGADGGFYTPIVYGYDFLTRYLSAFDELRVVAHTEPAGDRDVSHMLRVDGPHVEIYAVPFPHGKLQHLTKYMSIERALRTVAEGCGAAVVRVPDQLSFRVQHYARKAGLPTAVEVTSDPVNLYSKLTSRGITRPFVRRMQYGQLKRACMAADCAAYVTRYELQKRYPPNNAAYTASFTDTNVHIEKGRKPRTLPGDRAFRIAHATTSLSTGGKGHTEALRAYAKLCANGVNASLTLIGGGELLPHNVEIIKENKLKIEYVGLLSPDEVLKKLDTMDLFLYPSYNEGLPRVVVEAMSCGLPVVASDIPAHRELLDPKYLAPVKDSDKLAQLIEKMLEQPRLYTEASEASLSAALEYDYSRVGKVRDEFYQKLLEKAKR